MKLPSGVKLHNVTTGKTSSAGASVEICGGTKFYLSAPLTQAVDVKGEWSVTMKGSIIKDYSAYKITTGSETQDLALVFGEGVTDEKYVDFKVSWVKQATLEIVKKDRKSNKAIAGAVYGVYSDKDGKNLITKMPATDANGASSVTITKTQDTVMCYKNEYQKRAHGEVERIFRELLPEAGLHVREEQIRLCHEMLDALMKNEITLCDAGVGIGKTYAYLTACILMRKYSVLHSGYSGCDRRSVVVSTSSIALQKAIIEEYVPFLSDVLLKADLLQEELKAVVRKGKEHFVCDYRLAQRLEVVRDKNKNQVQMEALKSLRHNFDLDSVHNLSGFDRRLVCVPKFCPRECPGKAGCRVPPSGCTGCAPWWAAAPPRSPRRGSPSPR